MKKFKPEYNEMVQREQYKLNESDYRIEEGFDYFLTQKDFRLLKKEIKLNFLDTDERRDILHNIMDKIFK